MKNLRTIFSAAFLVVLLTVQVLPSEKTKSIPEEKRDAIAASLVKGLNSGNTGLITSSAYMLGELKMDEAVIPLMKLLHSSKNEDIRIAAALALYKIGNPRGIFAVKQAIRFDESERVKKLCANFYNDFMFNRKSVISIASK